MEESVSAVQVVMPSRQTVPLVFASPHSGSVYPAEFVASSQLDPLTLRRSEDSFVDELFGAAPDLGAPLIRALFPRAYLDPNREPYELDPAMFEDTLPDFVNTRSPRVMSGLGTIAKVVANGAEIYAGKLTFEEAARRIEQCYHPYHRALEQLVAETRSKFGCCILVDCHSMPSVGGPCDNDVGSSRVDVVLGNCYGTSCAAIVTETAECALRQGGLRILRNAPYAGGFTTRHYGSPHDGVHALQIELNRALYMDETTHERTENFPLLRQTLTNMVAALAQLGRNDLPVR